MSSSTSSPNTTPLVIGLVAILLVAGGFAVFGGSTSDFDLASFSQPEVSGEASGPGGEAPVVEADRLLEEGELTLPAPGEPTMLVFLAHWCPNCNAEVPVVQQWLDDGGLPEGVQIQAVATGIEPGRANFPPNEWLSDRDWTVPTVVDTDNSIANAYGLPGYPFWVFVDAEGNIVDAASGQLGVDQIEAAAQRLAEGA